MNRKETNRKEGKGKERKNIWKDKKSDERTLNQSSQRTHKHNPSDNDKDSPLPEAMRPRWHPYTHFLFLSALIVLWDAGEPLSAI